MGQPALPGTTLWPRVRPVASIVALATFMLLAGCGSDDEKEAGAGTTAATATSPAQTTADTTPAKPAGPPVKWTLVLDYQPNAVHAGLLRAVRAGYFKDAGITLKVIAPSSTADALTQVSRGRAEVGLSDLIDVGRRDDLAKSGSAQGSDKTAVSLVGAIVQRPLSGLVVSADSGITSPDQLAGKKIAVTGLPSDGAVINVMVSKDGDPLPVKQVTLGFDGLNALHAGRVDASTAYWPADAVTLAQLGTKPRTFALDQFGGPTYPGLVAFTTRTLAQRDPEHVAAFAAALARGTRDVIANPAAGVEAVQKSYPELDAAITQKQLTNYEPLFGTAQTAGHLDPKALDAFTAFAFAQHLTLKQLSASDLTTSSPATTTP